MWRLKGSFSSSKVRSRPAFTASSAARAETADGGLGQIKPAACLGKVAAFHNGNEDLQLFQADIHREIPLFGIWAQKKAQTIVVMAAPPSFSLRDSLQMQVAPWAYVRTLQSAVRNRSFCLKVLPLRRRLCGLSRLHHSTDIHLFLRRFVFYI